MTITAVRSSRTVGAVGAPGAVGPGRSAGAIGAAVMPLALSGAVLALVVAQLLAGGTYSATRDPLSGLEWTSQGWLFPVALMVLAVGLFAAAARAGAVRRWGSGAAALFAVAGVGAVAAALYPSDPPDALVMTGVGEVHRWASTAVLLLPLVATLRAVVMLRAAASLDPAVAVVRRRLVRLLVVTAIAGAVFLAGFLPVVLHSESAVVSDLAAVNGFSQRVLAVLMVACVWQVGRLATTLPTNPTRPTPTDYARTMMDNTNGGYAVGL